LHHPFPAIVATYALQAGVSVTGHFKVFFGFYSKAVGTTDDRES
jgi:hypothetical protein